MNFNIVFCVKYTDCQCESKPPNFIGNINIKTNYHPVANSHMGLSRTEHRRTSGITALCNKGF